MDKKPKKPIKFKVVKPKKEPEKPKKRIKFKVVKKKEEEKPKPKMEPKKRIKFKVVKKKEQAEQPKPKQKINFDEVEGSNAFLSGNKFIYDFEDFMTDKELQARTEKAQMKAFEKSSARVSKYIMKALKKIAREKKIKSTDEFITFLKTIKTGTEMRNLLENAVSKEF